MKYTVVMNGRYMNSFSAYSKAREYADWLQKRHPNNWVEIECD